MAIAPSAGPEPSRDKPGSGEKGVALKLFIELLSYQLASPVRWVETQQYLLQSKPCIQRFVEIGPRAILATMARKSAAIDSSSASSKWVNSKFLSYHDNQREITYRYQIEPLIEPTSSHSRMAVDTKAPLRPFSNSSPPVKDSPLCFVPSEDLSLQASHVVLAMTAQKLRRRFDQVSVEKTIRDLSGGKSTLQNELTGDFVLEFGRVPESVEDKSLSFLSKALQSGFSGAPGKAMSSLISRFISSKMPAGFTQGAIQDYISSRWGFTKSHIKILLCFAVTMEPVNRIGSPDGARAFLDDLVNRYAAFQGITLKEARHITKSQSLHTPTGVNVAHLDDLKRRNAELYKAQLDSLINYLDLEFPTSKEQTPDSTSRVFDLEERFSLLHSELDAHFLDGIKPLFDVKQGRQYDSWWNWSREDLVRFLDEICQSSARLSSSETMDRMRKLINRWDSSCSDIVRARLDWLRSNHDASTTKIQLILEEILGFGTSSLSIDPIFVHSLLPMRPQTIIASGHIEYQEVPRQVSHYPEVLASSSSFEARIPAPYTHIKTRREREGWTYDARATSLYHAMLDVGVTTGLSFANRAVLVTGAGPNSIAASVVQGLLNGGARIIVTTSRPVSQSAGFYQQMYRQHGAKGSSLTLYPMNQASKQDCEMLVQHIFGPESPIDGNLDYIVPFAAIPQAGEPDAIDGQQELALRAMLVNSIRLIGLVRREKERLRLENRPTMVVLPMSCNEGTFGGDGLYSEAKIGLKSLFNRFYSESWSRYLTICGAVIGWTRGTAIMQSSNSIAEQVEKLGVVTFSQPEMAFNILALMTPALTALTENAPIYADLTGGLGSMWNLKEQISAARRFVSDSHLLQKAIAEEDARQLDALSCSTNTRPEKNLRTKLRRARLGQHFPSLCELNEEYSDLEGMIDLTRVPVVVGYSELGPWGNARTRWEIEHQGELSLEGYVEMAWIMGLIQHIDGQIEGGPYVGWVDVETGLPVRDDEVSSKYRERIMSNAGLRLIKPTEKDNYDPSRKELLHEIAVEKDLAPFETSKSVAEAFKLRHGDYVTLQFTSEDTCRVHIKKGAVLMIPKAVPFDQVIAGKIPEGWDPARYGIPEDIVQQVDVTTLYALCCVSEAFITAGIKDPYELYQHIHVSELANCLGSGGGPMKVIQNMYRDRYLDRQLRGDIILEHFVNTMGAWVNMLLLSSTGPLKTPVGACATAIESLDIGCEAIQAGKCKVAVVGGCDDYGEELAYEFANIKATANSAEELSKGRTAADISRPTASSRSGFAESAGCGVQILMSASLAIEIGLPIYGVVAYTHMASDQISRSIPAPGQGILTAARETPESRCSPLLDLKFRRAAFNNEVAEINKQLIHGDLSGTGPVSASTNTTDSRIRDAQNRWGNNIRLSDPAISPIRASLATWGLTIDDIKVVSMHGTSTKANEVNEGNVVNTQMNHLGRQKGNPLLSVCQKSLTGHPKAAAGAWQLNGCLQMMQDRIIPGNRNADNIDGQLRRFEHLVYPMQSMKVSDVKATLLTSFGFGQKGAINIMVSPKYLFSSLSSSEYNDYRTRVTQRQRSATPVFVSRIMKNNLVQVKSHPPWNSPEAMRDFFLNPTSRVVDGQIVHKPSVSYKPENELNDPKTQSRESNPAAVSSISPDVAASSTSVAKTLQTMLGSITQSLSSARSRHSAGDDTVASATSIGVDIETISNININNTQFITRNFTPAEREYCLSAPNPRASLTGRWCAKEAVFKSLRTTSLGAGAAMKKIEIGNEEGRPKVGLYGRAQEVAASSGIVSIEVTISHCNDTALAVALASRNKDCIG